MDFQAGREVVQPLGYKALSLRLTHARKALSVMILAEDTFLGHCQLGQVPLTKCYKLRTSRVQQNSSVPTISSPECRRSLSSSGLYFVLSSPATLKTVAERTKGRH